MIPLCSMERLTRRLRPTSFHPPSPKPLEPLTPATTSTLSCMPTASAGSALAALLSPARRPSSLCPPPSTGGRPDPGGERPQLPQRPPRRSRAGPQVVAPPDDDGEGRGPPAARPHGGGRDPLDRQLADRRELSQQQRSRVSRSRYTRSVTPNLGQRV